MTTVTATEASDALSTIAAFIAAHPDTVPVTPPVVTPPVTTPPQYGTVLPTLPDLPVGPFTKHSAFKVTATNLNVNLSKVELTGSYECIEHDDKTLKMSGLTLQDVTCDANAGSLFYSGSMCSGAGAVIGRVACLKGRPGRPFFRFCGVWGPIEITDLTLISDPAKNTMTGDIGTGAQFGNKAVGEALESVIIRRANVGSIYDGPKLDASGNPTTSGWQPDDYWNGDGITAERTVKYLQVDNFTGKNITDGGIDSKARKNVFGAVMVENARCALKLWDDSTCQHLISKNPVVQGGIGGDSHLRLMGNAPDDITGKGTRTPVHNYPDVYAVGTAPLIRIENGPVEFHGAGHFEGPSLIVTANGGSITPNSTWNGLPIK